LAVSFITVQKGIWVLSYLIDYADEVNIDTRDAVGIKDLSSVLLRAGKKRRTQVIFNPAQTSLALHFCMKYSHILADQANRKMQGDRIIEPAQEFAGEIE